MMDAAWAAKLQAVFELSPTILTVTGLDDGRIVEVNDAFLLATGYSRDEVIGRSVPEIAVWVDPSQRDAGLAALRAGRSIRNVEARFRAKHGREIVAITNADVVVIDGRSCILTALVDITDRVHAEAALRESERRFAQLFHANPLPMTIVSHELRNPLGAITNALGVVDRLATSGDLRNVVGIIGRQTARLTRLVDDLLDVARLTAGKIALRREAVDLRQLAERCVRALREAGRVREHQVVVQGHPVKVDGDSARLEQVINNLLDNALTSTRHRVA